MGRLESAIKEFKTATSLNRADSLAWYNLYNTYKEVGRMEEGQEAYRTYEKLINDMGGDKPAGVGASPNPANIPGGVSQTGKLASGGSLDQDAGTEELQS